MKTLLKLQKFLIEKKVEWHYFTEDNVTDVVIFIHDWDYEEFKSILSTTSCIYDDEGLEVILKENYLAVKMEYILESFDLALEDMFDYEKREGYGL